ncbi:hypothetical protein TNCV_1540431 [Trichonephila clavipes]|nr:hypothetical protein TNCV_1540431 [Trichonephila clavipes]
MLNDNEIVDSMQAKSDPVDGNTDEDENNNNESSKDLNICILLYRGIRYQTDKISGYTKVTLNKAGMQGHKCRSFEL